MSGSKPQLPPPLPHMDARRHHFEFTHTFLPTAASSDKAGAFLPALANAVAKQDMATLWIKFGQEIVPPHEVVPPIGLAAYVFRIASRVAYLFLFPRALCERESHAALLLAGPLDDWPRSETTRLPIRYFVHDQGSGQETRIQEWTAEGYLDHGPGPAPQAVNDFSDIVLYRICGFAEESNRIECEPD